MAQKTAKQILDEMQQELIQAIGATQSSLEKSQSRIATRDEVLAEKLESEVIGMLAQSLETLRKSWDTLDSNAKVSRLNQVSQNLSNYAHSIRDNFSEADKKEEKWFAILWEGFKDIFRIFKAKNKELAQHKITVNAASQEFDILSGKTKRHADAGQVVSPLEQEIAVIQSRLEENKQKLPGLKEHKSEMEQQIREKEEAKPKLEEEVKGKTKNFNAESDDAYKIVSEFLLMLKQQPAIGDLMEQQAMQKEREAIPSSFTAKTPLKVIKEYAERLRTQIEEARINPDKIGNNQCDVALEALEILCERKEAYDSLRQIQSELRDLKDQHHKLEQECRELDQDIEADENAIKLKDASIDEQIKGLNP